MVFKRLSGIMILMTSFWAVFLTSSWLLAKFYMPWIRHMAYSLIPEGMVDILIWIGVVIIFGAILILYRKLFHKLFWIKIKDKMQ